MKKILFSLMITLLIVTGTACSESINEAKNIVAIKGDFETYLPQRDNLIEKDTQFMNEFNTNFVDEQDWDKSYESLTSIIDRYEKFLEEVKSVSLKTDEMKEAHDIYINTISLTLESFKTYKQSMNEDNDQLWEKADNLMEEASKSGEATDQKLLALADKYRINLKLE